VPAGASHRHVGRGAGRDRLAALLEHRLHGGAAAAGLRRSDRDPWRARCGRRRARGPSRAAPAPRRPPADLDRARPVARSQADRADPRSPRRCSGSPRPCGSGGPSPPDAPRPRGSCRRAQGPPRATARPPGHLEELRRAGRRSSSAATSRRIGIAAPFASPRCITTQRAQSHPHASHHPGKPTHRRVGITGARTACRPPPRHRRGSRRCRAACDR
jgi:hypothetical protein